MVLNEFLVALGFKDDMSAKLEKATKGAAEKVDKLESSLDDTAKKSKELGNELGETADSIDDTAKKSEKLGRESKKTGDSLEDAADKSKKLGRELKETGEAAEKSGGKFEKLGGFLKGMGVAMGAVSVAAGAAAFKLGQEVVAAYADYEQLVGGVDTLFGESSKAVQRYADNAYKTAGLSANAYMETVTGFSASLIQSLGGDTEKAAKVADMAITDMADNANKMGSDISTIQDAYQGFAKQNYMMLDNLKLGYGGTKTEMERLLADAEKFSGMQYDISSYADVSEAIHVIQTEMGITGTTAKEASETISGSMASMKSAIGNLMAGLGNADADIEMLINNVIEAFRNVVKNITPVIENLVTALPTVVNEILQAVGDLLSPLLSTVANLFRQVLNTILTLLPQLIPAAVEAVLTIVSAVIDNLPLLVNAALKLVMTLAEGIATALPHLIPAAVNAVTTIVQGLVDNLPMLLNAALRLILGLTKGILAALPQLIAALPAIITGIVDFIIGAIPQLIDAYVQLFLSIVQALPQILSAISKAVPQIIDGIDKAYTEDLPKIIDLGIQSVMSLIDGIVQSIPQLTESVVVLIPAIGLALLKYYPILIESGIKVIVALTDGLIQALPQLAAEIPQIVNAVIEGLSAAVPQVNSMGQSFVLEIWNGIQGLAGWLKGKVGGFVSGVWDGITGFFDRKTSGQGSGPPKAGHAEGGVFDKEHIANFAEGNKAEAVIPLTKPARAAEVMRQAADYMDGSVGGGFSAPAQKAAATPPVFPSVSAMGEAFGEKLASAIDKLASVVAALTEMIQKVSVSMSIAEKSVKPGQTKSNESEKEMIHEESVYMSNSTNNFISKIGGAISQLISSKESGASAIQTDISGSIADSFLAISMKMSEFLTNANMLMTQMGQFANASYATTMNSRVSYDNRTYDQKSTFNITDTSGEPRVTAQMVDRNQSLRIRNMRGAF